MTDLTNKFSRRIALIMVILSFYFGSNNAISQVYNIRDHWYLGPQISVVSFFGDLSVHDFDPVRKFTDESDFGLGIMMGKSITRLIDMRVNYCRGKMRGSNPGLDMYFKNHFNEINLEAVINLSNLLWPYNKSRFKVTANTGIGYVNYRSIKYSISTGTYLSSEGYSQEMKPLGKAGSSLSIPVGFELDYYLGRNWMISGGFSFRLRNEDLLDSQTGSTGISDRYSLTSAGFSYIINPIKDKTRINPARCPDDF